MDDEGGEPIYIQAQSLRSSRLPQKISSYYNSFGLNGPVFLETCLIYKVGALVQHVGLKPDPHNAYFLTFTGRFQPETVFCTLFVKVSACSGAFFRNVVPAPTVAPASTVTGAIN